MNIRMRSPEGKTAMLRDRWTPEQIERWEKTLDAMEEKERWRTLHFSPDPYGVFGSTASDQVPLTAADLKHFEQQGTVSYITTLDKRPDYKVHPRIQQALLGLLAMYKSCAVQRVRPDIYEGYTYLTPEGVLVDIGSLEDAGLAFTRLTVSVPDGSGNDYSKVYELNETGRLFASRMWTLAKLFDGGKTYELQTPGN